RDTGFGDTLSTLLAAGQDEHLLKLVELLVGADLTGDPSGVLELLCAEVDFIEYDSVSGTDTAAYLRALSPELRRQVEQRAIAPNSPLANWYIQLQGNVSIAMSQQMLSVVARIRHSHSSVNAGTDVHELAGALWYVPVSCYV
ncbi:MAG TPA: hypothetical protein VF468_09290, partial [Actinomycetota bacterium]|nr:hypothetical protein [Actinomycetota bacterium]